MAGFTAMSDDQTVVAALNSTTVAAGTTGSAWVSLGTNKRLQFIVQLGALATGNTIDAKLQQASDTNGTGVKDITSKAITQLSKALTSDNKVAVINLNGTELDVNGGFSYARLLVTVGGTNTAVFQGLVLGHQQASPPTAATAVAQVVP